MERWEAQRMLRLYQYRIKPGHKRSPNIYTFSVISMHPHEKPLSKLVQDLLRDDFISYEVIHETGVRISYYNDRHNVATITGHWRRHFRHKYREGGDRRYMFCMHSYDDEPSYYARNSAVWTRNGQIHREIGPAVIDKKTELYVQRDRLHNVNGPAYVSPTMLEWYQMNLRHRDEDQPAVIRQIDAQNERYEWYRLGSRHRERGPAIVHIRDGVVVKERHYKMGYPSKEDKL